MQFLSEQNLSALHQQICSHRPVIGTGGKGWGASQSQRNHASAIRTDYVMFWLCIAHQPSLPTSTMWRCNKTCWRSVSQVWGFLATWSHVLLLKFLAQQAWSAAPNIVTAVLTLSVTLQVICGTHTFDYTCAPVRWSMAEPGNTTAAVGRPQLQQADQVLLPWQNWKCACRWESIQYNGFQHTRANCKLSVLQCYQFCDVDDGTKPSRWRCPNKSVSLSRTFPKGTHREAWA